MPKINYKKLELSGDFAAAATSIRKRGTSLKADVGAALYCSLAFIDKHGDYKSSVEPLLDAIKDAFGKNLHVAAQEYVMKFSWLAWNDTEKKFFKDHTKVMDLDGAAKADWWATERKPKAVPFDAQKKIDDLFKAFDQQVAAGNGTMDAFLDLVIAKAKDRNPDLAVDLFRDLSAEKQNEALQIMVNIMTPANAEAPTEVEAIAA